MGGSSTTNTVTKQDNTPWGPAQPSLQNIYTGADAAYAATPKTAYSGLYIAPQSQSTLLAQQLGMQLANKNMGMGDQVGTQAKSLYDTWSANLANGAARLNDPNLGNVTPVGPINSNWGTSDAFTKYVNDFISGTDNGTLQAAIAAAQQPIYQNLTEKIIPQAKLNAVGSGVYGGDASTISMGQAINDNYTTAATNAASQLAYQDYANKLGIGSTAANTYFDRLMQQDFKNADIGLENNRNQIAGDNVKVGAATGLSSLSNASSSLMGDWIKNLQAGYQLNALPIDTLTQIGQAQDSYSQDVVKAMYQQWMDQINAPWQGLEQYRTAVSGYPVSSSGSSTGTSSGGGLF